MSGREWAIEALIDRDPRGSYHRAKKVAAEAADVAQSSRPNLITVEALVDQAFHLERYEINTLGKYDAYESPPEDILEPSTSVDAVTKERILLYYKQQVAKNDAPPANLVSGLRRVFEQNTEKWVETDESNTFELRNLLEHISSVFPEEIRSFEQLLSSLARDTQLPGILFLIVSLLSESFCKKFTSKKETDGVHNLQVGGLLYLFPSKRSPLNTELLEYFGRAAAVYQERDEIQKARMLAKVKPDAVPTTPPPPPTPIPDESPAEPEEDASNDSSDSDEEDDDDEDDDDEEEEDDDDGLVEDHPVEDNDVVDTDEEEEGDAPSVQRSDVSGVEPEPIPVENTDPGPVEQKDNDAQDEDDLPPLPNLPNEEILLTFCDFADGTEKDQSDKLDPSSFSSFGGLSRSSVLRHLLRFAEDMIEMQRFAGHTTEDLPSVFPGGIGSNFPGRLFGKRANNDVPYRDTKMTELTIQLLAASFLLAVEQRRSAIECLNAAIARERNQSGDVSDTDDQPDQQGEADDPAMTLAMNYVEDDVPLSPESLENKGMMRKAAAAAHELAALQEAMRRHTANCRKTVEVYEECVSSVVKMFKQYLQSVVRSSLKSYGTKDEGGEGKSISVAEYRSSLPSFVTKKIGEELDAMSATKEVVPLHGDHSSDDLSDKERTVTNTIELWGECIPLLLCSRESILSLLTRLVEEFRQRATIDGGGHSLECSARRLEVVCHRLRQVDTLGFLLSTPAVYTTDGQESLQRTLKPPVVINEFVRSLDGIVLDGKYCCEELQLLYLALCHRYHAAVILMDGLYYLTETDNGGSFAPGAKNKQLNTGDTVQLGTASNGTLIFDHTKCADSIAIVSDRAESKSSSVSESNSLHQRASKVWGTTLSSKPFNPKSGVHRWAIRMDKCERGHIFIGVATSQASTKTYVGGDKYGWGMIGTQALWHDRRKIKGDYGSAFKTGSTIIVTLDTDSGTLSFSSWRENATSASFSLDQSIQNVLSPRRSTQLVGTVEDWGIAFEGLPLDAKLFPAVGLYQRDDRVTLLPIESCSGLLDAGIGDELSGTACYYPLPNASSGSETVAKYNSVLNFDGIKYAAGTLDALCSSLAKSPTHNLPIMILNSLSSSLSLLPASVPVLSKRTALILLPHLERAIKQISTIKTTAGDREGKIFTKPKSGSWKFYASNSRGLEAKVDSYEVELEMKDDTFDNQLLYLSGYGLSKERDAEEPKISIAGSVSGSSISFSESESKRSVGSRHSVSAVSGRLTLDGKRFEGVYRNIASNSVGHIVGFFENTTSSLDEESINLSLGIALLVKAYTHLTNVLELQTNVDFSFCHATPITRLGTPPLLSRFLNSSALRHASLSDQKYPFAERYQDLDKTYLSDAEETLFGIGIQDALVGLRPSIQHAKQELVTNELELVSRLDEKIVKSAGGTGSLRAFDPRHYDEARQSIISAILFHCGGSDGMEVRKLGRLEKSTQTFLETIWNRSLQITENAVRRALSRVNGLSRKDSCVEACRLLSDTSSFLMTIVFDRTWTSEKSALARDLFEFYGLIEEPNDLIWCEWMMKRSSFTFFIGSIGIKSYVLQLSAFSENAFIESEVMLSRFIEGHHSHRQGINFSLPFSRMDSSHGFQENTKKNTERLVSTVSERIEKAFSERKASGTSTTDSFVLSASFCLFSLIGILPPQRFVECSNVLKLVPKMMTFYLAESLLSITAKEDSLCETFRQLRTRETSQAILNSLWSMTHLLVFETTRKGESSTLCKDLVELLKFGLSSAFNSHESVVKRSKPNRTWIEDGISCILEKHSGEHDAISRAANLDTFKNPIDFFVQAGMSKLSVSRSKRREHVQSCPMQFFADQLIKQWLHILNVALLSPSFLDVIGSDRVWCSSLMDRACGLPASASHEPVPANFRSRILRLLYEPLRNLKPSNEVIETLFDAASRSSCMVHASGSNELSVSTEAVSLLRRLYHPSNREWYQSINSSIAKLEKAPLTNKIGVLCFFSGVMSQLTCGSYVIIKPAAASLFSNEERSFSNLKAPPVPGGSSSATNSQINGVCSHHVVGNGTEAIVSGLCTVTSPGGIVTSIDMKTGLCEVLLLDRTESGLPVPENAGHEIPTGDRLTIRALRKPLSDLVEAPEVPLYLGSETKIYASLVVSLLESSTTVLKRYLSYGAKVNFDLVCGLPPQEDGSLDGNGPTKVLYEVMALRTCIIFLSHRPIAEKLLVDNHEAPHLFQMLLELAWPDEGNDETQASSIRSFRENGMSALPSIHARYCHLLSLEKLAAIRTGLTKNVSDEMDHISKFILTKREMIQNATKAGETPVRQRAGVDIPCSQETDGQRTISNTSGVSEEARSFSQSTGGSNSDEDDEAAQAADREAAIAQMAELGLPRALSELALRRTGGVNIEAAVTFCLERGPEIERLLAEEQEREDGSRSRMRSNRESSQTSRLLQQLLEMGFPRRWCLEALTVTGNNVDEALTWILNNGERLSEEDEAIQSAGVDADDFDDEEESTNEEDDEDGLDDNNNHDEGDSLDGKKVEENTKTKSWTGSVTPLRFISGKAIIDSTKMEVSGLPSGGFSSVGTKGILLTSGKWYYEAILETAGCLQIGWADGSFSGHCHADRGDGCGDGPSSWAFDGWRRYRWHASPTEWGCKWNEGDVVGCMVDMDQKIVSFTLNGKAEEIGMGVAFSGEGFRPCGGVYACASFNRKEKLRIILGGASSEKFRFSPPMGYRGVGEAVLEAVDEYSHLIGKESVLDLVENNDDSKPRKFLCDFSDAEHGHELMAWAHRYYGSDASVHLGSGRNKQTQNKSQSTKGNPGLSKNLSRRLETMVAEKLNDKPLGSDESVLCDSLLSILTSSYSTLHLSLCTELVFEVIAMTILLSRKVILHTMITMGKDFDPQSLLGEHNQLTKAHKFWRVIETCTSLRHAGWVGEAGAMALSAEALGLGISSADHVQHLSGPDRRASGASDTMSLPCCGSYQLLTSVLHPWHMDGFIGTAYLLPASAEATICANGGSGMLGFIKEGLQRAVSLSNSFREHVLAVVRRSIRILAGIEYDEAQDANEKVSDEGPIESKVTTATNTLPDARLASFLSGLLLRRCGVSRDASVSSESAVFEAWSIGLLSASIPFRMLCAFTASGILNQNPQVLRPVIESFPTMKSFFRRLPSTVARRLWAERAALPICSRYAQAMADLACAVENACETDETLASEIREAMWVDAATPLPWETPSTEDSGTWESQNGFVNSGGQWDVLLGSVEIEQVDWKNPRATTVHGLMDSGEGPPMVREGCTVMRGIDWDINNNDDGKDLYDLAKVKREEAKKKKTDSEENEVKNASDDPPNTNPTDEENKNSGNQKKTKSIKVPGPKLSVGTVLSIEDWGTAKGKALRVKWKLTGKEGTYRFGGDGGRFDLCHVEINSKGTKVKKKYQLPESAEQCAARHGFGKPRRFNIILRVKKQRTASNWEGVMEWPDFCAGILVHGSSKEDGSTVLEEKKLLFGSRDSGWFIRFGQPSFVPGTKFELLPNGTQTSPPMLCGATTFMVTHLRNPEDGGQLYVKSKMTLPRLISTTPTDEQRLPQPFTFDSSLKAPSLAVSKDGRTLTCTSADGRASAFASIGFSKGVHYWEVKVEQTNDIGCVFIGVAEKPMGTNAGSMFRNESPKLNKWHGFGFVNFRATYAAGAERVYGSHYHSGDTVGVLLDCDAGRVSFFFDGLKYGEHILNDLGCAFENLSPFGFNVDGCGSGGYGEGAPSGFENGPGTRHPAQGTTKPRTLWPVIGLKNEGDRVSLSPKWSTSYGIDGVTAFRNVLRTDRIMRVFDTLKTSNSCKYPHWFVRDAFGEYKRWQQDIFSRCETRESGPHRMSGFGLEVDVDSSPIACARACANLGLEVALLRGDRVKVSRSAGRILELAEEAIVLGACNGRLYYRLVSQKSEGGSLTEGGGRAWFWDESEVVDGICFVEPSRSKEIRLPLLSRFADPCSGGLKIVYSGGAVVRTDIEIFDGSANLGTIPCGTLIPPGKVLERRVNSCGVVRYRVESEEFGIGWISAWIRAGPEDPIVKLMEKDEAELTSGNATPVAFATSEQCAEPWFKEYRRVVETNPSERWLINDEKEFLYHSEIVLSEWPWFKLDTNLVAVLNAVCDFSGKGDALDCDYEIVVSALEFATTTVLRTGVSPKISAQKNHALNEAVARIFADCKSIPPMKTLIARIAMLRAMNRRVRFALPYMSLRPCQEGSAVLGGLQGYGTSPNRVGRSCQVADQWVQLPSTATRLRDLRDLIFTSTKREFLESIVSASTSPTPLSHDEYELPREIRTVRLNRLKAGRAMMSEDRLVMRKHSVFAQLHNETKNWGGAALRRSFVAKGHGGQKRAFKVKLVGEGVNDYSGPYREAFTGAVSETLVTDNEGNGLLGVLDCSPNNALGIGNERSSYMFSLNNRKLEVGDECSPPHGLECIRDNFQSLLIPRDEAMREVEEALVFLGRLSGTAHRHGISVDLPLPLESVWKAITEESTTDMARLNELDSLACKQLGDKVRMSPLLHWQQRMLNSFAEGLGNVLPLEILPLLSGKELRDAICGNPEVDVNLLKAVVEYEGYKEDDDVIQYFWQTLYEMSNDERKLFLQFVWARNRLPSRQSEFGAPFKIIKDKDSNDALPSASTCFFSLTLPNYSDQETLRSKLLFAIRNVTTMETDFQTTTAEISEGYRNF